MQRLGYGGEAGVGISPNPLLMVFTVRVCSVRGRVKGQVRVCSVRGRVKGQVRVCSIRGRVKGQVRVCRGRGRAPPLLSIYPPPHHRQLRNLSRVHPCDRATHALILGLSEELTDMARPVLHRCSPRELPGRVYR